MTGRDDARAAVDQGDLFDAAEHRVHGAMARAVSAAVDAAGLDAVDGGMAQLAVECGRAVDVAQRRRDPYAVAAAARELRETLIRLRLDPTSREGATGDQLDELLRQLATPTLGDAAHS